MLSRLVLDLDEAVERAGRSKLRAGALTQLDEALDVCHRALDRVRFVPMDGEADGQKNGQNRTSEEQVERQRDPERNCRSLAPLSAMNVIDSETRDRLSL